MVHKMDGAPAQDTKDSPANTHSNGTRQQTNTLSRQMSCLKQDVCVYGVCVFTRVQCVRDVVKRRH